MMTKQGRCGRCNQPMDPARATSDKNGALVCVQCAALNTISEGDGRASTSLIGSALSVLAFGRASWTGFNVFSLVSIVALFGGMGWIGSLRRLPAYRARLGSTYGICLAAVILGMLSGVRSLLFGILSRTLGVYQSR